MFFVFAEDAFGRQLSPTVQDIAIGIKTDAAHRQEFDSMGYVMAPADRYWGAQTQRSLQLFSIGDDRMPKAVYHAYGCVKKAYALVNHEAGRLPEWKKDAIVRAADETIAGKLDENYPLYVWRTSARTLTEGTSWNSQKQEQPTHAISKTKEMMAERG